MKKSAWFYPKASHARKEYADGRIIDTLKPEYMTVTADGTLRMLTVEKDGPLGLSQGNAKSVKASCKHAVFTISCKSTESMEALCADVSKRKAAIEDIVDLLDRTAFEGVELDWEDFGAWTDRDYSLLKTFLSELHPALKERGRSLSVCVPPITGLKDPANGQQLYKLKYEEVAVLCDFVVIMAYDKQFDFGNGTPVAPLAFIKAVCAWALAKIPKAKIVIGLPTYGYMGTIGQYRSSTINYYQATKRRGFNTAKRNTDGEMGWTVGRQYFCFQDAESINIKMRVVQDAGLDNVCFWVLGNNLWPTS